MKYYAVQVRSASEDTYLDMVNRKLSARRDAQRFIFLKRALTVRRQGKITQQILPVFPGYIFVEVEDTIDAELFAVLRHTNGFFRILHDNTAQVPLSGQDLLILQHFMQLGEVAGASLVCFDENERIIVKEGPLKGLEGSIIKVDRRKQRAKVQLDFESSPLVFDLAFTVIEKGETHVQQ